MIYLNEEQLNQITTHCRSWLMQPVELFRSKNKKSIKVFDSCKVRWGRGRVNDELESLLEIDSRQVVLIDWVKEVWVIPYDGWRWFPVPTNDQMQLPKELIGQLIIDKLQLEEGVGECMDVRQPIGITGINKFITIRCAAYKDFGQLLAAIRQHGHYSR